MTAAERGCAATTARAEAVADLLPAGTLEQATISMRRGLEAAGYSSSSHRLGRAAEVRSLVLAPVALEPDWPGPSPPLRVGAGWVHADLTDEDHDSLARLREVLNDRDGTIEPEVLAAEAQQWRLPVTPYRRPSPTWPNRADECPGGRHDRHASDAGHVRRSEGRAPGSPRIDSPLVVDLTALWAGPLATMLLARLGATVIKVDSDARPDGLRAHDAVYRHLNGAKQIEDLDLRREGHRIRFEELLARADLIVDSFSRRVLPNLGYAPTDLIERHPRLHSLSIVAFDSAMAEADWVSYGPGVHAMAGLGHAGACPSPTPSAAPVPAPIAYPDALAGLAAFATATAMLTGRSSTRRAEVSLAEAVGPLVATAIEGPDPSDGEAPGE